MPNGAAPAAPEGPRGSTDSRDTVRTRVYEEGVRIGVDRSLRSIPLLSPIITLICISLSRVALPLLLLGFSNRRLNEFFERSHHVAQTAADLRIKTPIRDPSAPLNPKQNAIGEIQQHDARHQAQHNQNAQRKIEHVDLFLTPNWAQRLIRISCHVIRVHLPMLGQQNGPRISKNRGPV